MTLFSSLSSTESGVRACSGIVYDRQTNRPMASVAVSNGRDVVLTDASGRYSLPDWHKADFVTVTVPSGYWSENYYIPVSRREESYDFYLDRLEDNLDRHTFLQVTDSEVGSGGAGQWVEKLRETAALTHPAFIVHTGDICYIEGLKAHIRDMNSENMGIPVRYVIGNHDYVNWGDYGEALFESIYGPVMYSFEVGRIHYIVTPIVYGDVKAKYTCSDVAVFVQNDLRHVSADKKIIMFNHNFCAGDETGFVLSDGALKIDLRKNNLLAWVFGHWHYNYLNEIDGIFNITTSRPDTGGIDASPATIRSVVIKDRTLEASHCYYNDFKETLPGETGIWSTSLEGNILYSAPAVKDGTVYAGTVHDGWPKTCGIYALHEETGKILWKYRTKNSVKSDIRILDNKIITQDTEGNVYCLDPDGKELWTRKVNLLDPNNSSSSIAVKENRIYCGGQQRVFCLQVSDGSIVWEKKLSGGNTSPSGFVLYKDKLFVGAHWDRLYALNPETGEILWTNNNHKLSYFVMTPGVSDGYLFTGSWNRLYKIHGETGRTEKYRELEGCTFNCASTPYIEKGVLYTGTTNRGVIAVDTESLELLWTFETGKNLLDTSPYCGKGTGTVDSPIVPAGENLCFGGSDGVVYLIDKNGKKLEEHVPGSPVNQAPVIDGNFIITADFSGNVTCFGRRAAPYPH